MACIINAESGTGLTNSADGSGILKLQSAGKTTNALAWVNFNGTGTVAIRSSYNVSSITDNGTGDYTVNFATALSDANYSISGCSGNGSTNLVVMCQPFTTTPPSASSVRVQSAFANGSLIDTPIANVTIHGN
jgi:hypothetical protein